MLDFVRGEGSKNRKIGIWCRTRVINKLDAGQLSHKQALMQARKLEATTPYNLEIQNFIANRLWALGLQDEASEVYERAYKQALAHIPKGFKGQITLGEVDNRPFLRLAHGTLLGLMRRRDKAKGGEAAMVLAKQMLAWCPIDNIGVRFLLGDRRAECLRCAFFRRQRTCLAQHFRYPGCGCVLTTRRNKHAANRCAQVCPGCALF